MPRKKPAPPTSSITAYEHTSQERLNNPPVGLVTPATDPDIGKKTYTYDPHLDPQLVWAGKAEHTSFEVPTVSLHVHERIDSRTIIDAVRKSSLPSGEAMGEVKEETSHYVQLSLFEKPAENPPIREAIEFYRHKHNWSNRLIAGDSLLVMNSLLEKEGFGGQVQMIYLDPPYGIKYGSNFQPFVNKRYVTDGRDEDLTSEPEQIQAFRDTWELGIHSYLAYLRDRFILSRDLLHDTGSIFIQISVKNVHLVRSVLDEIFGINNFVSQIAFRTATGQPSNTLSSLFDYLLWYAKDKQSLKYITLFRERSFNEKIGTFSWIELESGDCRQLSSKEKRGSVPFPVGRLFKDADITQQNDSGEIRVIKYKNQDFRLPSNLEYIDGVEKLMATNRLVVINDRLCGKRYEDDNPLVKFTDVWEDTIQGTFELTQNPKKYVVQTNPKVIARCMLMTTDPGDLVLDPTCGSGTTAFVAEQWGRRWITCDTSRVALTLARTRLMTASYDYYELAHAEEGVASGFKYKTVSHITLKSIANNEPPEPETLYDRPTINRKIKRVTGPFTVEAVPAPAVRSLDDLLPGGEGKAEFADASVARSGETLRQAEWRAELLRTGIRARGGQVIRFARLEPLPGCRWLHADGETQSGDGPEASARLVVSFGPEHAPLEKRQVERALEEAQSLVPRPRMVVFAAFQFDPQAARDIDETIWPGVILLKAQMNADLLTEDLKKKRTSNESFWLIGQPDVRVSVTDNLFTVEVLGFDYYNTRTGNIESGGAEKIAVWLLDTDYDGRSLFPRQVFFPMSGAEEGWSRLAKNLRAEIDPDLIEAYRGVVSLPFRAGDRRRIAVKVVDDRGIESLKVMEMD
jgi:adenine-specific DNA-methyltransferase